VDQVLEHIDNPPVRVVDEDKFVAHSLWMMNLYRNLHYFLGVLHCPGGQQSVGVGVG
jgi:hypothetical protein